ncbi:hypothetical protein PHMEG_00017490 [Phytophthora megakarya]|uniref:Eukaryotic/viral aspartic protease n=1 Tax=Phytophthora megakarya TaxID=4795 RepID=A0A225VW69_9STRA|nr:hypothetical protein PHMEG_00017490 [Phytophthora megakarya]
MTPITEGSASIDDSFDYSDAKEDDEDDYLEEKTHVSELSEGAVVSVGRSGGVKALARNLAEELEEVAGPAMDPDDDGSDGSKPAYKVIGKTLELMMTKSSWMQVFGPTLVRQAVWMNLGGELVVPIDSTSTRQVAQYTVMLLKAMKLRAAFGVEEITPGRQVVARQAFMPADPSKVPLPQTPVKPNEFPTCVRIQGIPPYMHDSPMVTPRSANRQDRVVKGNEASQPTPNTYKGPTQQPDRRYDLNEERARQIRELSAKEEKNSTPRIKITTHLPLGNIKAFSGYRHKSENSM